MKILFVSMHYKPEPCDTRTSQLAQGLAELGHETTALTSFPNYPFGKVYEGYKQRIRQRENIDGVNVVRVPMVPDHSMSKKKRALSYLSFGFSAALLGAFFTRRPDLIWIHHPPLTTGIAGYLLAKLKCVPFVFEIHDLWPETLMSTGMIKEGRITRAIRKVCHFLHTRAKAVVVTSPGMKDHLAAQGLPPEKIHVFPQWAPTECHSSPQNLWFGIDNGLAGKFNVMFTGNLGVAQALDTALDAAARLRDLNDFQLVFVGAGVELERLRTRCHEEGLTNVKFVGQVSREQVGSYLAWANGLLVHLRRDHLFEITIPSKTQVYLAEGRPILCGVGGDTSDVIESSDAGICFEPEDAAAMADAIRRLYGMTEEERSTLGANARAAYARYFDRKMLVGRYDALFNHVLGRGPKLALVETVESEETAKAA